MGREVETLDAQQQVKVALGAIGRRADALMLSVLGLGWCIAIWMGVLYGSLAIAAAWGGLAFGVGAIAFVLVRGTLASRLALAAAGMAMVALHIQLSMGMLELHFGVFVYLALLLAYRDWRPIVCAAAVIAVHHIAFDRLQLWGLPLYCLTEPDFGRILIHAAFVVVQTAAEVGISLRTRADASEAAELHFLCQPQEDGQLALDVSQANVRSAAALELRDALLRLNAVVSDVHGVAQHMSGATREIATGHQQLSDSTAHTTKFLREAASSVEQLGQAVRDSAQEAISARTLANEASDTAQQCGGVVAEVVNTMQAIHDSAKRIADIAGVIDSIAFQTNILALNAAVEAARAGEQGRGFAVVASEVRALAGRSAAASKEVRALITSSLAQVERGATLVTNAGHSMGSVVERAQRVSHLVGAISAAVEGESNELGRVSASVRELDEMAQRNNELAQRSVAAATELAEEARRLAHVASGFRFQRTGALTGLGEA